METEDENKDDGVKKDPLTDPKAIEALFGAGTKNADGTLTWNLTGDDALKKLGLPTGGFGAGGVANAIPPLPTPPPAVTETAGQPLFIPSASKGGGALQPALLVGILLAEFLQLAALTALLALRLAPVAAR